MYNIFLILIILTLIKPTHSFNDQEISNIKLAYETNSFKRIKTFRHLSTSNTKFLLNPKNKKELLGAIKLNPLEIISYNIGRKANLSDIIVPIKEFKVNNDIFYVSKFIRFIPKHIKYKNQEINKIINNKIIKSIMNKHEQTINAKQITKLYFSNKQLFNLFKSFLNKSAIQRLYLYNFITHQSDCNQTNLLFQINDQGEIIPIEIDLEAPFGVFGKNRYNNKMYKYLFKGAINTPITNENLKIIEKIINTDLEKIILNSNLFEKKLLKEYTQILKERITMLSNYYKLKEQETLTIQNLYLINKIKL